MAKTRQAKIDYNAAYNKKHCIMIGLNFTKTTDADILSFLQSLDNKQGFIKKLIRKFLSENA